VLERSVAALREADDVRGVVVVLAPEEAGGPRGAAVRRWPGVLAVVAGGATRLASARRGVEAAGDAPFVMVHDAARPLVGVDLVRAVMAATRRHGAAIPVLPVPDTVTELGATGLVARTLDRDRLGLAQTPQGSRTDWLRDALAKAEQQGGGATDEAAALERAGRPVAVVPGDPLNRKITTPEDLADASRRLAPSAPEWRVGSGFDIHRLGADRTLVLGGVPFPGEPGLIGHSDADVVLHAAMDALLGAVALGDIGQLFPPEDPRFEGADSALLAREVAARVRAEGYEIVNLDLTLLAERPKIRQRGAEMRAAIGRALGVDPTRIGLKATTLERLGALGRGEGIACEAVACVRRTGQGETGGSGGTVESWR